MDETALIVILVVAVVIIVGVAWWLSSRRRRDLHDRFGPEYERTVEDADSRRAAERELREREERREGLDIVPLDDQTRTYYATEWQGIQQRFVDAPAQSVAEADVLVMRVMRDRGYPMDDFERQAANVSVDHPDVVEHYRSGHTIAERSHTEQCDTEELREAVVHYRALFESLLEDRAERSPAEAGPVEP
jgi:FtsZ-interacting cell division protein ZipA